MSAIKEEAIELIRSLPEDCTVEGIQYHLDVRRRVARGLAAVQQGRVVPRGEAERRVAEWSKSSGPTPR